MSLLKVLFSIIIRTWSKDKQYAIFGADIWWNKGEELNVWSQGRLQKPIILWQGKTDPVNDWYLVWQGLPPFVLSYPPHLVRHYISRFELDDKSAVLDPFCGTGTTLVTLPVKNKA